MNALQTLRSTTFFLIPLLAACASTTPGAAPRAASIARHDAIAKNDDRKAAAQLRQYDPKAGEDRMAPCRLRPGAACWTSTVNPTAEHLDEAKKYQRMAAEQRAASQTLRDAEARACVGLTDVDRDVSPFAHKEDIAGVDLVRASTPPNAPQGRVDGVKVTFRAVPGLSVAWLQRVVDCHIARSAALGYDVPQMKYCPLVPKGATAQVTQAPNGIAVTITSSDPSSIPDIVQRGEALAQRN